MSAEPATVSDVEPDLRTVESLYVVRVLDHIDGRIAGHDGRAYVSPPAPRDNALALVGLLGSDPLKVNGAAAWTRAVPGGRRTVTLAPAPMSDGAAELLRCRCATPCHGRVCWSSIARGRGRSRLEGTERSV